MDPHRKDGTIRSSRGVTSRLKRSIQFGPESTSGTANRLLPEIFLAPSPAELILLEDYVLTNPSAIAATAASAAALAAQTAATAAALAAATAAEAALAACPTLADMLASPTPANLVLLDAYVIANPPPDPEPTTWTLSEIPHSVVQNQWNGTSYVTPTYELNDPPPFKPTLYTHTNEGRPPFGVTAGIYNFAEYAGFTAVEGQNAVIKSLGYGANHRYRIMYESYNIDTTYWELKITHFEGLESDTPPSTDANGSPLVWRVAYGGTEESSFDNVMNVYADFYPQTVIFNNTGPALNIGITDTVYETTKDLVFGDTVDYRIAGNKYTVWAKYTELIPALYPDVESAVANNWMIDRIFSNGVIDDTYLVLPRELQGDLLTIST
jgi:hypothetical protein